MLLGVKLGLNCKDLDAKIDNPVDNAVDCMLITLHYTLSIKHYICVHLCTFSECTT